jgi:methionyl aminopeptidase
VKKSTDQVARMRRAGRVVAEMHELIRAAIRPGVTTARLDLIAREVLERRGAVSSFLGYHGFPAVICASPNDMVVHGIPNDLPLDEGDLVSIDCGAIVDGWHGDAAFTATVGAPSTEAKRLIEVAEASLSAAIDQMVPGHRLSDVGHAVQLVCEQAGFQVVRDYVGHGIGTAMHEDPDVPNYGPPGKGPELVPGVVLAVEPMVTIGSAETVVLDDGWSVVTADGSLAAHVEHTIAVTDHGPEILTRP